MNLQRSTLTAYPCRPPRTTEDTLRSTRDAYSNIEITKKVARRTEVPLGKHGFDMLPSADWRTQKQATFITHPLDIRGDRMRAEALKVVTSGPTASTGAVTASHMKPRHVISAASDREEPQEVVVAAL